MGIDFPFMVFETAPWNESGAFNNTVIIAVLGVLVLTIVLWPIGALVRWHYARPLNAAHGRLRVLVRIVCLVDVAFAGAWAAMLTLLSEPGRLNDSLDPILRLVKIVGMDRSNRNACCPIRCMARFRGQKAMVGGRVHAVAIMIACVGFSWFLNHWHMLRFSLKY